MVRVATGSPCMCRRVVLQNAFGPDRHRTLKSHGLCSRTVPTRNSHKHPGGHTTSTFRTTGSRIDMRGITKISCELCATSIGEVWQTPFCQPDRATDWDLSHSHQPARLPRRVVAHWHWARQDTIQVYLVLPERHTVNRVPARSYRARPPRQ